MFFRKSHLKLSEEDETKELLELSKMAKEHVSMIGETSEGEWRENVFFPLAFREIPRESVEVEYLDEDGYICQANGFHFLPRGVYTLDVDSHNFYQNEHDRSKFRNVIPYDQITIWRPIHLRRAV